MKRVNNALVIGGGIAGMSTALELEKLGVDVHLIDLDPNWRVYGAGITITGPTLRAFKQLGILDEVVAHAYTGDGIQICSAEGQPLSIIDTPMNSDPSIPSSGGIMRPLLHSILARRLKEESSVRIELGITVDQIECDPSGSHVTFSTGSRGNYDMVIGADGLFSRTRQLKFPDAPLPHYTGQTCWRLIAERPASVQRRTFFLGGPWKVGLSPVSADTMYMFLLQTCSRPSHIPDSELPSLLKELLKDYGGPLRHIRENVGSNSSIIMRPLEAFLLTKPWHSGNTLLIGDAAHPTTPQLASGAGMAVEDALVLAEELRKHGTAAETFTGFMRRRYPRCRLVVENSIEIGRLEQNKAPISHQTRLVEESLATLAQPL